MTADRDLKLETKRRKKEKDALVEAYRLEQFRLSSPSITPSSDEEWKSYWRKKEGEVDRQLSYVCSKLPHILRLSMSGDKEGVVTLFRMILRNLLYPRDKEELSKELKKYISLEDILRENKVIL